MKKKENFGVLDRQNVGEVFRTHFVYIETLLGLYTVEGRLYVVSAWDIEENAKELVVIYQGENSVIMCRRGENESLAGIPEKNKTQ
jgi:hypothetical protein